MIKSADLMFKMAALGAIVFLPTGHGKYLMQDDKEAGCLRPPGGHAEKEDPHLTGTILREINEEFGLDEKTVRKTIKFLGFAPEKKYWSNGLYELKNHGLTPGLYVASNNPDEKIKLVECTLDDPRYKGPKPGDALTAEEKAKQELADPDLEDGEIREELEKAASIAVDLDGTLAEKVPGPFDPAKIGPPISKMVARIRRWIRDGKEVVIFTARAHDPENLKHIRKWLKENDLAGLRITNEKTPDIEKIYDDRAVGVYVNTGHSKTASIDWHARLRRVRLRQGRHPEEGRPFTEQELEQWGNEINAASKPLNEDVHFRSEDPNAKSADTEVPNTAQAGDSGRFYGVELFSGGQPSTRPAGSHCPGDGLAKSASTDLGGSPGALQLSGHGDGGNPAEPPKTGPEAIGWALDNLNLDQVEKDAMDVVHKKLKSKRPDAVKKLGFVQGFKRSGLHPRDLMISRVPVIPPQFRPYAVAGDTFIPGDANEFYRDLINMRDSHKELEHRLGPEGAKENKLHLYDAVSAVYGFADPVSTKTKERGVSGFMQKLVGSSPKFSYGQRRLLSREMDFTGRGVIGVDPDLGLDEVGVPDDMMWKLYAPYIQRRLVRAGMTAPEAVRAIKDRTSHASKMLDLEAKERPVIYSRAPSWHKFNVIAGYPKRIEGDSIMINPFTTTSMNADFDGDQMNVHVPALPEAVEDTKNILMPSKMLFGIKKRGATAFPLKQEQVLGAYLAQQSPAKKHYNFPDEAAALAAVRSGKVRLSDEISIAGQKP